MIYIKEYRQDYNTLLHLNFLTWSPSNRDMFHPIPNII